MAGWIYRENRVPHYQRLYQKHDNLRLWEKHPRSRYLLWPFRIMFVTAVTGSTYGILRMILGHKTWFSKG
ncbi:MAG: hypothetical protein M1826_003218 [Phylliscum demangeonii]|nr:MAG: hypothetical protein M1826_003218 [Phylliscum demangeonii]